MHLHVVHFADHISGNYL